MDLQVVAGLRHPHHVINDIVQHMSGSQIYHVTKQIGANSEDIQVWIVDGTVEPFSVEYIQGNTGRLEGHIKKTCGGSTTTQYVHNVAPVHTSGPQSPRVDLFDSDPRRCSDHRGASGRTRALETHTPEVGGVAWKDRGPKPFAETCGGSKHTIDRVIQ